MTLGEFMEKMDQVRKELAEGFKKLVKEADECSAALWDVGYDSDEYDVGMWLFLLTCVIAAADGVFSEDEFEFLMDAFGLDITKEQAIEVISDIDIEEFVQGSIPSPLVAAVELANNNEQAKDFPRYLIRLAERAGKAAAFVDTHIAELENTVLETYIKTLNDYVDENSTSASGVSGVAAPRKG